MKNNLPILALETSGDLCSAAVLLEDNVFYEYNINKKHIHSEKLPVMIQTVLESSGISLNEINHIAVSNGPGSFTGLRIGLAAAKGIAFGIGLPIVPVPTFDACALQLMNITEQGTEFVIISQAGVDDVYLAKYLNKNGGFSEIIPLQLTAKSEIENYVNGNDFVAGSIKIDKINSHFIVPTALHIANWSYIFGKDLLTYNYDYLEPNYFKNFTGRSKK